MNLTTSSTSLNSILMYSHDGFGLGHLKRNFNIAKKAVQTFPNTQALLIMGHPSVPFFPIPEGIDFVKLPSIIKVNDEQWRARRLRMSSEYLKEMRSALIKNVAEYFQPKVFLVDYVPKGVWNELLPTLEFLKKSGTKILLGLRDIIDDPEVTRKRWKSGNTYEIIQKYYDHILIYGSPYIFDTARHYFLDGDLGEKVIYCGYLCSEEPYKDPIQTRRELGINKKKFIVITAGGGGDAYPMMKLSLEALALLKEKKMEDEWDILLVTGPLMDGEKRAILEKEAYALNAKVLGTYEMISCLMNAADLLITMGSYNTMMEAVRFGRPTLVIPREGPSAEQQIRARIFSDLGYVHAVKPSLFLKKEELATAIEKACVGFSAPSFPLEMRGLSQAMQVIGKCMNLKTQVAI